MPTPFCLRTIVYPVSPRGAYTTPLQLCHDEGLEVRERPNLGSNHPPVKRGFKMPGYRWRVAASHGQWTYDRRLFHHSLSGIRHFFP